MKIATYTSERDNRPEVRDLPWPLLARLLTAFREGPCTAADCIGKKCPHKSGPAWSPVEYAPGSTRANRNVLAITALVFDLDHVVSEEWEARLGMAGIGYLTHATHTSRPDDVSLRLVIPLSRPATPAEHRPIWEQAIAQYGLPADLACGDPARLYYMPSAPAGAPLESRIMFGAPLDVDGVLASVRVPEPAAPAPRVEGERPPASADTKATALRKVLSIGQAIEGKGGDALTVRAAFIAKNDFDLTDDEALDVLERWDAFNEPPWGADGLRSKIQNAERYASGETGAARAAAETKAMLLGGAVGGMLGLPPPEPEPEPGSFAAYLKRARALVADKLGEADADTRREREPMFESAATLLKRDFVPPKWLVTSLITEGGLGVVATEPKAAKTWAATEIAIGVSTGTLVFGRYIVPQKGRVAYFYAEDLGASVASRIRALCDGIAARADLSNLFAQPRGRELNLCSDEDLATLLASCWMLGPIALLVLDPLRNIHTGEEDSSDAMSKVMARMRFLSIHLDATVLFVHHSKKQSRDSQGTRQGQMMRGSSAIHGAMDSGIYFSNLDVNATADRFTNRVLSEVKGAKGAGMFDLTLSIKDDPATQSAISASWSVESAGATKAVAKTAARDEKSAELDERVLEYLCSNRANTDQLRARLNVGKPQALDAVTRLEQDGLIQREDYLGPGKRLAKRWAPTVQGLLRNKERAAGVGDS